MKKILFSLLFFINVVSYSQEFIENITDFFEFELGSHNDDSSYVTKLVLAPIIAFEPSTSLQFGVGSKLLFKFPNSTKDTRTSNLPISATYTLRKQFILGANYTVFSNRESFLYKGNLRFLNYPFSYFGVGNTSVEDSKIEVNVRNILVEPLFLKRLHKKIFLGGGIRYNYVWGARLIEEENVDFKFDELNNLSSGIELAISQDSRDNVLNALNGTFIEFTHGVYNSVLGGDKNFGITKLNARKYVRIKENRLDVLAFEFYSRYTCGDVPLFELSSLGGAELLRGFQEQRFNDKHTIFLQTEYRWQTFKRLGFVGYAGVGDVFSNVEGNLRLDNLKYSIGTGMRIKIVKSENLNIRLDYAVGLGPSRDHNFYLGLAEAF